MDDDGDVGYGTAVVADFDGDEPAGVFVGLGGHLAWGDVDDAQVGEATVVIDPIVEEPA